MSVPCSGLMLPCHLGVTQFFDESRFSFLDVDLGASLFFSFSLLREWASVVRPLAQLVLLDEYVDGWGICELPNTSWAVFV